MKSQANLKFIAASSLLAFALVLTAQMAQADDVIIANGFKVTWHDCIYDLTEQSCNVDIQNLNSSVARDFNISALISNTSYNLNAFDVSMTIKEWKAIPTAVPTYANRTINETLQNITHTTYYGADNSSTITILLSDASITSGTTYLYNIIVNNNGTEITGMQSNIIYNSSEIQVNSVTEGNLFKGAWSTFYNSGTINNVAGNITNIYSSIIGSHNTSTSGTFITLNTTALKTGTTTFSLNTPKISSTNSTYVPFLITQNKTYYTSYIQQYQNGTELKNVAAWKPTKSNMLRNGTKAKMYYGSINIPKYGSKEKYDDLNNTETVNGTKRFLVEWKTPIVSSATGYGSSGKIAFWDESTNTEYHPWWDVLWNSTRAIMNNTVISPALTNYPFQFNITRGSCNADFSDLRVTQENGTYNNVSVPYWIEGSVTGVWAQVWFNGNSTAGNVQAYAWCGNPSATSKSNITSTFLYGNCDNNGNCRNDITYGWFYNSSISTVQGFQVYNCTLFPDVGAGAECGINISQKQTTGLWRLEYDLLFNTTENSGQGAGVTTSDFTIAQYTNECFDINNYNPPWQRGLLDGGGWAWGSVMVNGTWYSHALDTNLSAVSNKCFALNRTYGAYGNYTTDINWKNIRGTMDDINSIRISSGGVSPNHRREIYVKNLRLRSLILPEPLLSIGGEQNYSVPDTTPPNILIKSPLSVMHGTSIVFKIFADESLSNAWFSLDGAANVSMLNNTGSWNYLNTSMVNGIHNVRFFANDTSGNVNASIGNNVSFTLSDIFWNITGGTITSFEDNTIHTFLSNGTFSSNVPFNASILVIAGGGAGGGNNDGGGGGAGGLIYNFSVTIPAGTYAVTVGAGGIGVNLGNGNNGTYSNFSSYYAKGGGGGTAADLKGYDGGSGGGAGESNVAQLGGNTLQGSSGFGYVGGNSTAGYGKSGSGGGAGAAGTTGDATGAKGGTGKQINISGSNTYYACGGGSGGVSAQSPASDCGEGVGGRYSPNINGAGGTNGTGSGGGGGGDMGGMGGTGIVIISYDNATQFIDYIDLIPPQLVVLSPINNTKYSSSVTWFNITSNENLNWSGYSLDGAANVSMVNSSYNWNSNNQTMAQGYHYVIFYANDTSGNLGISETYSFLIDSILPVVTIDAPKNNAILNQEPYLNGTVAETNLANITTNLSAYYNAVDTTSPFNFTNTSVIPDGTYTINITATDLAGNKGWKNVTFSIDRTPPLISNITYSTSGGFTASPLQYLQVINFIRINATDANLQAVNISVYDPDGINVNNQLMLNESYPYWNYTSSVTLNKAGVWSINISNNDTAGNVNSISTTFSVTTANTTLADNWYGYSNKSILTPTEISNLAGYGYNIYEFEDNTSNMNNSWATILSQINNSYNQNVKVGINYLMNYNYTNTAQENAVLLNISNNFADLLNSPYSSTIMYISFEPINQSKYASAQIDASINKLAKNATDKVANKFVIYSKNYNSSGLDSSYIQKTTLLYLNDTTETSLINTENSLLRNNSSYNRVYVQINDTLKTTAQNIHNNVIKILRSSRKSTTISDIKVAEQTNGDIIVFNNQSTAQLFIINASGSSKAGKDAWDSTNKYLIEQNTDLNFSVNVSAYSATVIYFDDIDHIVHNSPSFVVTASVPNIDYFNYTDGTRDGNFGLSGAYDIQIELFDPNYKNNEFLVYYGWLNVSSMSYQEMCQRNPIIIADKNAGEIRSLIGNCTSSEIYGYIAVGDYVNTDAWTSGKKAEVDNWLAQNASLDIFIDGLDIGVNGVNFTSRMKDIVDYVQITKSRKAILNTYTAYQSFATWGTGGIMKESCVNRWNGALAQTPDNYTRENWTLELQKADWFQSHNVKVICQAFGNRSAVDGEGKGGAQTISNYSELENIYFASKVLGYDYFYLSQPDFQYAHLEKVYNVGTKLANSYSTDDNETYYRKYSKGIIYYNTTSHDGWIADNRQINNITVCFDGYINAPYSSFISFRIGEENKDAQNIGQYTINGVTGAVWKTYCKSGINQTDGGRYLINAWSGVHTDIVGQGVTIGWAAVSGNGAHSWYDNNGGMNTWNSYPKGQNWEINLSINDSYSATLDSTTFVNQSTSNTSAYTNLTLSSTKDFNMTIWSSTITVSNVQNITYLSGSNWITVNYVNNTDCDSNAPTWNSTTIAGETHKACIKQSGTGYKVRVATPHLSSQIYQITEQSDTTPPEITIQSPSNSTYGVGTMWFNITLSEAGSWAGYSLDNMANITMTNSSSNWNAYNGSMADGHHTVIFFANDTFGNMNSTNISFTTDAVPPVVTVNAPSNIWYDSPPYLNGTATDATSAISAIWTNVSYYNGTDSTSPFNFTNTSVLPLGNIYVNVSANDSAGNVGWVVAAFKFDNIPPSLALQSPINTTYGTSNISLNYTAFDANSGINKTWYSYNGTNTTLSGNTTFTGLENQSTLTTYSNDSAGNINSTSVTFTVSTTPVIITSNYPANASHYNPISKSGILTQLVNISTNRQAECRYSASSNISFENMTLSFTVTNSTTHSITQVLADGIRYDYYVRCNDTIGHINTDDYYFWFDIAPKGTGVQSSPSVSGESSSNIMQSRISMRTEPNKTTVFTPLIIYCDYESGIIGNNILGARINISVNNMRVGDKLLSPIYNGREYEATFIPASIVDYNATCSAAKEGYASGRASARFTVLKTIEDNKTQENISIGNLTIFSNKDPVAVITQITGNAPVNLAGLPTTGSLPPIKGEWIAIGALFVLGMKLFVRSKAHVMGG